MSGVGAGGHAQLVLALAGWLACCRRLPGLPCLLPADAACCLWNAAGSRPATHRRAAPRCARLYRRWNEDCGIPLHDMVGFRAQDFYNNPPSRQVRGLRNRGVMRFCLAPAAARRPAR